MTTPRFSACTTVFLSLALSLAAAAESAISAEPVHITRLGRDVSIDNGLVRARFTVGNGVRQEYDARRGGDWGPAAEAYRPGRQPAAAAGDMAVPPLYDAKIDPRHRLIVGDCLDDIAAATEMDGRAVVTLRGVRDGTVLVQTVELRPCERFFRIEARATLADTPPQIEYLLLPFAAAIAGRPETSHAPGYQPSPDAIVGDRVFFSPLGAVQQESLFVGVVPDVEYANAHTVFAAGGRPHPDVNMFTVSVDPEKISMPTGLSLHLPDGPTGRPIIGFGLMDANVKQHVWFQHPLAGGAMLRKVSSPEPAIGFDLLLDAEAPRHRGHEAAARHIWNRVGHATFLRPRPQALPLADYAKVCYPAQAAYQGYTVHAGQRLEHRNLPDRPDQRCWQEWELDGRPVGGFRLHAPQWFNLIAYSVWWNNTCDATGLYFWGRQTGDDALLDKARRIVNLALAAPQHDGLVPSFYDLTTKRWIPSLWSPPRDGYDPRHRAAYFNWSEAAAYQSAAASVTAGYLMQYRRTCEDDPQIVPCVQRLGDFLVKAMDGDGCVPAWFDAKLEPLPSLLRNADGGAHAWVLAELYLATKEPRYLEAAKRAAEYLRREVMPRRRWADFEAFYSCAIKPETFHDDRTGQGPCNTMSMSWALQGFLALHEATGDRGYLDSAAAVADSASLFQTTWAPEFVVTAYPFGGVSSQLGDAEWLDQRAHRFADPFIRIGLLTGRSDLIERGVAAARSSLTLSSLPEHKANGIHVHSDFPPGIGPENVDHEGYPQRPLGSGPSWGPVGGLAGAAHALDRLGGAYVDAARGFGVGVDGVTITRVESQGNKLRLTMENPLARLPVPQASPWELDLRIAGLAAGEHHLVINGGAPVRIVAAADRPATARLRVDGQAIVVVSPPSKG